MRKTLIPALVAGLIVLMASAAQAATRDLTDPTGDVMTATVNEDGEVSDYHREGGAEGDITFARIQHTATQVVVYMRYRQLSVPRQYAGYLYTIQGNNENLRSSRSTLDAPSPRARPSPSVSAVRAGCPTGSTTPPTRSRCASRAPACSRPSTCA